MEFVEIEKIAYFFDLQNVRMPRGVSITDILARIRNLWGTGKKEVMFVISCAIIDIKRGELEELTMNNVDVVVIPPNIKGAADCKLIKQMMLYANTIKKGEKASAVVITGDGDFLDPIITLKYQYGIDTFLLYGQNYSRKLFNVVKDSFPFQELMMTTMLFDNDQMELDGFSVENVDQYVPEYNISWQSPLRRAINVNT